MKDAWLFTSGGGPPDRAGGGSGRGSRCAPPPRRAPIVTGLHSRDPVGAGVVRSPGPAGYDSRTHLDEGLGWRSSGVGPSHIAETRVPEARNQHPPQEEVSLPQHRKVGQERSSGGVRTVFPTVRLSPVPRHAGERGVEAHERVHRKTASTARKEVSCRGWRLPARRHSSSQLHRRTLPLATLAALEVYLINEGRFRQLSRTGAALRSRRWNPLGLPAIYTSLAHLGSMLEVFGRAGSTEPDGLPHRVPNLDTSGLRRAGLGTARLAGLGRYRAFPRDRSRVGRIGGNGRPGRPVLRRTTVGTQRDPHSTPPGLQARPDSRNGGGLMKGSACRAGRTSVARAREPHRTAPALHARKPRQPVADVWSVGPRSAPPLRRCLQISTLKCRRLPHPQTRSRCPSPRSLVARARQPSLWRSRSLLIGFGGARSVRPIAGSLAAPTHGDINMRIYEPGSRGWHLKRFVTSTTQVPPVPGIYVLSQIRTTEGLPVSIRHLYIGKSQNLGRRLDQHTMRTEVQPELQRFMMAHHNTLWVWYTTEIAPHSLNELEVLLIRDLHPKFNTHHKPKR